MIVQKEALHRNGKVKKKILICIFYEKKEISLREKSNIFEFKLRRTSYKHNLYAITIAIDYQIHNK